MTRPDWDSYFMALADLASLRGTCDRKQVGAVLVRDRRVIATGYNGAPAGMPSCDEVGHEMVPVNGRPSCVRTLHAESNAIDWAGREARGATIYTTAFPCYPCALRIVNAGITRVCYGEHYDSQNTPLAVTLFVHAGVLAHPVRPVRHPLLVEAIDLLTSLHQDSSIELPRDVLLKIEDLIQRAK